MSRSTDNLIKEQEQIDLEAREQHRADKVSESFPHPRGWSVNWEQEGLLYADNREQPAETQTEK